MSFNSPTNQEIATPAISIKSLNQIIIIDAVWKPSFGQFIINMKYPRKKTEHNFYISVDTTIGMREDIAFKSYNILANNSDSVPFQSRPKYFKPRAEFIAKVMAARIRKAFCSIFNLTEDDFKTLARVSFKLSPKPNSSSNRHKIIEDIINLKYNNEKIYSYLLSDLCKYRVAVGKYIFMSLQDKIEKNEPITEDYYKKLITTIPKAVKKTFNGFIYDEEFIKEFKPNFTNRFQCFMAAALQRIYQTHYDPLDVIHRREDKPEVITFRRNVIEKFLSADTNCWETFKKYMHFDTSKHYTVKELFHLIQVVLDGDRLYAEHFDNKYKVALNKIEGSALHMLKNAIFNHHQERELQKKRLLSTPNKNMPKSSIPLPEWIETIRLKTHHEMIIAGIECHHCIGSYTSSNDIFVREDSVCAQIYRDTLEIGQCFDINDTHTEASKDLQKRLNESLKPIREKLFPKKSLTKKTRPDILQPR
jgi:hypothetical protein